METERLSIKEWAEEDRPREKLLLKGAAALTDAELIGILIGSGSRGESAVQLAQRILHSVDNNLIALGKLSIKELTEGFKGMGEAKAVSICAALELGKRRNACDVPQLDSIRSSRDAFLLFQPILCDLPHEELWIALLSRSNKVIRKAKISQGGISESTVDIRLILKMAVESLASGMVMCHNHPSGNLQPSKQDDDLTRRVREAGKLMCVTLLDHLIISDNRYYSYADEGKL